MIPSSFWSSTMSNAAWASRAFKASVILKLFQLFLGGRWSFVAGTEAEIDYEN